MAGKKSKLQQVIDKLCDERAQLDGMIERLVQQRDTKPTRQPRKAKAEKPEARP